MSANAKVSGYEPPATIADPYDELADAISSALDVEAIIELISGKT